MDSPEPRKSNWLVMGCLIAVVVAVAAFGIGGFFLYRGYQSVSPVTEKFFSCVDTKDFKTAYSMTSSKCKAVMTIDQFTEFEDSMHAILGKYSSASMSSMNLSTINGSSMGRVVYNAQFANGPATVTFTMETEGGEWKVQGVHYNSDLIQKAMLCPACNKQNATFGKFCSFCGKPMNIPNSTPAPAPAPK